MNQILTRLGKYTVSTVDLRSSPMAAFVAEADAYTGHNPDNNQFETMVFDWSDNSLTSNNDLDCAHYSTEEAARAGHELMVAKWAGKEL